LAVCAVEVAPSTLFLMPVAFFYGSACLHWAVRVPPLQVFERSHNVGVPTMV
jgi:hypothetical protein